MSPSVTIEKCTEGAINIYMLEKIFVEFLEIIIIIFLRKKIIFKFNLNLNPASHKINPIYTLQLLKVI